MNTINSKNVILLDSI